MTKRNWFYSPNTSVRQQGGYGAVQVWGCARKTTVELRGDGPLIPPQQLEGGPELIDILTWMIPKIEHWFMKKNFAPVWETRDQQPMREWQDEAKLYKREATGTSFSVDINMTPLSSVLIFINFLLLSSFTEGEARGEKHGNDKWGYWVDF